MDFKKALGDGFYCLELKSENKNDVIAEMVDLLVAAGKIPDRETVLQAVMDRESKMSTGVRHGVDSGLRERSSNQKGSSSLCRLTHL